MTPTVPSVSSRLVKSVSEGVELSNKLFRVVQLLPSAVYEYGHYAGQVLQLATNLELINNDLPAARKQMLEDIDQLVTFSNEAYSEIAEALPQREERYGEIDLFLPADSKPLEHQIEGLHVASILILAVLKLGIKQSNRPLQSICCSTSILVAESTVNQVKKAIRDLKCSQPKQSKRKVGVALKRAKTHRVITEFLESMLLVKEPIATQEDDKEVEEKEDGEKEQSKEQEDKEEHKDRLDEESSSVKMAHFNSDPKEDGMPDYLDHHPDNVYTKMHINDVDKRSLNFHRLPFSKAKDNDNYYIIWKPMESWECENVFQHTRKLRINEEHISIQPKDVMEKLLNKWMGVQPVQPDESFAPLPRTDFEDLDKQLEELKAQDDDNSPHDRPIIRERPIVRDRSFSPPPGPRVRPYPYPRRVPRYPGDPQALTSKTEYWRSWGDQRNTLNNALKISGWQPVYMRGTDAGQTWFFGPEVVHIRRFNDDYVPQDGPSKDDKEAPSLKEYLIVSTEWIEEEALIRHGFQYQLLPSGHWSLDSRLSWGDVELLVYASSTFREERLYRKFRNAAHGDLHEETTIHAPEADYLNGSPIVERFKSMPPKPVKKQPASEKHVPHRLEEVPEEKEEVPGTPSLESHDSFVEVSK